MRKFFITCFALMAFLVGSVVVLDAPPAYAVSLYQCVYRWYPYTEIWTTNGDYAMFLNNTGWRCVKWR